MKQLDLFETGDLQPIRRWLHVWDEATREKKKAESKNGPGKECRREEVDGHEDHQAASS